jgi:phosphate transport system substrate-binding protein
LKHLRAGLAIGTALTAMIALSSCASNEAPAGGDGGSSSGAAADLSGTLNGVGSSAQSAAEDAWRQAFQTANSGVTVNYDPAGSGAGRTAFIGGGAQFAGSDAYLSDEELAGEFPLCADDAHPIDLPVYISPIAIAFNVEGVDTLNLSADTVAGIFAGKITKWNDSAITADNDGVDLPNATINVVRRSDDSGTTENFTTYLHEAAPDVWTEDPSQTWPFNNGDGASGTSGVIDAITGGKNTIGYADFSRAGDLGLVSVGVGSEFVAPSAEGASAAVAAGTRVEGRESDDLALDVDHTSTDPSEYPVALVSYAIACSQYADADQGALVGAYLSYVVSDEGQQAGADAAGSAPLSGDLAAEAQKVAAAIK